MKRILLATLLATTSMGAFAAAPGSDGCGWGNLLFKGGHGVATHVLAATTNGSFGNNTFGMTSGTNGCHTNGALTYGGKPIVVLGGIMDELSEDMAKGDGEALTTYAVVLGVQPEDRAHFAEVAHQHFAEIFSSADVTAADVYANTQAILKQDARLARYAEPA